jgi:hypothetical protein
MRAEAESVGVQVVGMRRAKAGGELKWWRGDVGGRACPASPRSRTGCVDSELFNLIQQCGLVSSAEGEWWGSRGVGEWESDRFAWTWLVPDGRWHLPRGCSC